MPPVTIYKRVREAGRGSLDVYHRLARHYGITLEAGDA